MVDPIANFAYGTILTPPSPATTGTSFVLNSGQGTRFPNPSGANYNVIIKAVGERPLSSNSEIVRVTAKTSDTFTITREQESTTARTIIAGDEVYIAFTKKTRDDIQTEIDAADTAAAAAQSDATDALAAAAAAQADADTANADLATHAADTSTHGVSEVVGTSETQTLTNKRNTPRVGTTASGATITPTGDTADQYNVTALAEAATIAAPSGTPTHGQKLILRLKDNGTARALTWNSIYRAMAVSLPTTTVLSKTLYLGFIYNSTDTKWDLVASVQEA